MTLLGDGIVQDFYAGKHRPSSCTRMAIWDILHDVLTGCELAATEVT